MEFGYCLECKELNYALLGKSGVFDAANMSNNHAGHRQYTFGAPAKYCGPVRNVLTKLQAMAPLTHNEIVLFKLAISLADEVPGDLYAR